MGKKNQGERMRSELKVQLIEHPVLSSPTIGDVARFHVSYLMYVKKVASQGDRGKAVSKADCVDDKLRRFIARKLAKKLPDLKDEDIEGFLGKVLKKKKKSFNEIDAETLFTGVKMKDVNRSGDLETAISEYEMALNECLYTNGCDDVYDEDTNEAKGFRRASMSGAIDCIQAPFLRNTLKKRWTQQGKNWKLNQLFDELEEVAKAYRMCLDEQQAVPMQRAAVRPKEFQSRKDGRSVGNQSNGKAVENSKHELNGATRNMSVGAKSKPRCGRCGYTNHATAECKLPDGHRKILYWAEKLKKKRDRKDKMNKDSSIKRLSRQVEKESMDV